MYRDRAWVIVDAGQHEAEVVNRLRNRWTKSGWSSENFQQFTEHDFERYYPAEFSAEVDRVLEIDSKINKKQKFEEKTLLLEKVLAWVDEDDSRARDSFKVSASAVIQHLKKIEIVIAPASSV